MTRASRQQGYTLVEMMMAFVGLLAVSVVVFLTLSSSSQHFTFSTKAASSQSALRNALDTMESELQWANRNTVVVSSHNASSRIDFQIPTAVVNGVAQLSTTITYRVDVSTLDANANGVSDEGSLVRIQDGQTRVVCQRVKAGGLTVTQTGDSLVLQLAVIMPNARGGEMDYTGTTTILLKNGS